MIFTGNWAIIGNNGSGKTIFGKTLSGSLEGKTGYISFESIEALLEEERKNDDSDFMDMEDKGTLVKDYIRNPKGWFNIDSILDRGLKYLSTGELLKVLILKELENEPENIVLDEPYDGLDRDSQELMLHLIHGIIQQGINIILVVNREVDIHPAINNVAFLHNGRVLFTGTKSEILNSDAFNKIRHFSSDLPSIPGHIKTPHLDEELISFKNINISFGDTKVLKNISWSVRSGEHYKIVGPNGCGKSTLLKVVSADNHQSYGQDITLFSIKRGSGESIWDIKRHIGIVSSALQKDYRVSVSLLSVVVSGFFDSIGLYQDPTNQQIEMAIKWLEFINLLDKKDSPFKELSYGEQRLGLIARAMIKHPKILILDEPCLGLDQVNREMILLLLDTIAKESNTTLLYVSHRKEDNIPSIKKCLTLG